MAVIVNEAQGTISFTDCVVTFPYGFNVSSGVGTIIITPAGGVASFPLAIQGADGLPPRVNFVMHEVAPSDSLPVVNPVETLLSPGGPGIAPHYQYDIYLHKGDKGDASAFNFLDADDLTDHAALKAGSAGSNGHGLSYVFSGTGAPSVAFIPQKTVALGIPGAFAATAPGNTSPRLLSSVTMTRPFPWRPFVAGGCPVVGEVDTRVDLVARLGDPSSGFEVGRGVGLAGVAPPPPTLWPVPAPGADLTLASTYVAANVAGTVHLLAEQLAASSNNWNTGSGRWGVWAMPV